MKIERDNLVASAIVAFLLMVLIQTGFIYFMVNIFFTFGFKKLYVFLLVYNLYTGLKHANMKK